MTQSPDEFSRDNREILYDDDEFSIRETYPAQEASARAAGWDDPLMDEYDHYDQAKTKMNFHRGDVISLNLPGNRPALIVQTNRNNQRFFTTIVAVLGEENDHVAGEPTQLLVDLPGQSSKIVVHCESLLTVRVTEETKLLGQLPPETMKKIDECLTYSLGLI